MAVMTTEQEEVRGRRARRDSQVVVPPTGEWRREAACRFEMEIDFFPETQSEAAPAKQVCLDCPVMAPCKTYALDNHVRDGVWGGTSELDRKRIWKEQKGGRKRRTAGDLGRCPSCRTTRFVVPQGRSRLECLECQVSWYREVD